MKLKEYVANLNKLISERPETADYDVIKKYNDSYVDVDCLPVVGRNNLPTISLDFIEEVESNAVCVN